MKQNAGPAVMVAAIVVALLFLVFLGWKSFGSHGDTLDQATIQAHQAAKKAHQVH